MARSVNEIKPGNDWVPQIYTVPTHPSLLTNIKEIKQIMSQLISGRKMVGNKILIWLMNSMPFAFSHTMWGYFSNKTSMCYSNFPGPKKNFNFGEVKGFSITPFTPIIG